MRLTSVLREVVRVAPSLHKAGTLSAAALEAVVRHASERPVRHSVETGSGASTILLSHLSADEMFELREVVDTTSFFRRTDAPTFSPLGDSWWTQRYNQRAFEGTEPTLLDGDSLLERVERPTPFYLDRFGPVTDPAASAS